MNKKIGMYSSILNIISVALFAIAKIIEMEQVERNKIALYLFNSLKINN